jgi:hypothetical protein
MTEKHNSGTPVTEGDFAYPILTKEVTGGRAGGGTADGDLGRLAEQTISDVLGWRLRPDDAKAFTAALDGSFAVSRVEGHNEVTWTPRGYAVQADLGAVTGGQASLAARSRAAVKEALPLLAALRPLRTDADPQDCEAFRSLVRYEVEQLQAELESPLIRVERVDSLFALLTGQATAIALPTADTVTGHLAQVRDTFGLLGDNVNDIEEERIQTAFVTLVDWVAGLQVSYTQQQDKLAPLRRSSGFLGTTLVVLSAQLSAVAGQVDEVEDQLDSVLLSRGERQTILIKGTSLSLDGLLSWVRTFAEREGKLIIDSGGKDAIETAFTPVAVTLRDAVRRLTVGIDAITLDRNAPYPDGISRARVQVAFAALDRYLSDTVRLARGVHRRGVTIIDVDPFPVEVAGTVRAEVRGFLPADHSFALVVDFGDGTTQDLKPTAPKPLGPDTWTVDFPTARRSGLFHGELQVRTTKDHVVLARDAVLVQAAPPPPAPPPAPPAAPPPAPAPAPPAGPPPPARPAKAPASKANQPPTTQR